MNSGQQSQSNQEAKIIVLCENCYQKLRIPRRPKKLRVTCPRCRHEFGFRHYPLGFTSNSKLPLLVGLVGSLAGFAVVELIEASNVLPPTSALNALLDSMLVTGAFGMCLGAAMGASEGFFRKDRARLSYGLRVGAVLGLVSGVLSGLIAQIVFSALLGPSAAQSEPSTARLMFARIVGWCVLGLLIGGSYGIKENTTGDVRVGLLGGAIGGAVGGLLFDPLSSTIQVGGGTAGRFVAFLALGIAISLSINGLRDVAIGSNRPDMYQPLTRRLPANPRLSLPPPSTRRR